MRVGVWLLHACAAIRSWVGVERDRLASSLECASFIVPLPVAFPLKHTLQARLVTYGVADVECDWRSGSKQARQRQRAESQRAMRPLSKAHGGWPLRSPLQQQQHSATPRKPQESDNSSHCALLCATKTAPLESQHTDHSFAVSPIDLAIRPSAFDQRTLLTTWTRGNKGAD